MPRGAITDPADTSRGQRFIVALERYRYLTIQQLMDLTWYKDRKYVEEGVRKLANAGHVYNMNYLPKVATLDGALNSGMPPSVVSLMPRGRTPRNYDARVDSRLLQHVISLNDVLIALEQFPILYGQGQLLTFLHDFDLKSLMQGAPIIPDGYIAYDWRGVEYGFAIELDRGTESYNDPKQSTRWRDKIFGYLTLIDNDPRPYLQYFPYENLMIAVVVRSGGVRTKPPGERLKELVHWTERAIAEAGYPAEWSQLFRFTTADPRQMSAEEFVLGEHWVEPHSYQLHSLLPRDS